jgi:hypothetical protein
MHHRAGVVVRGEERDLQRGREQRLETVVAAADGVDQAVVAAERATRPSQGLTR